LVGFETFEIGSQKLFEAVIIGCVDNVGLELDEHGKLIGIL
jgi:hypothetical protein